MIIRAINGDGSPQFGQGTENFLRDNAAIEENIATRLRCFLRDCFFDQSMGLDWLRFLGIPTKVEEVELSVRAIILQSYGVTRVIAIQVEKEDNRNLNLSYTIDTIFGTNLSYTLQSVTNP